MTHSRKTEKVPASGSEAPQSRTDVRPWLQEGKEDRRLPKVAQGGWGTGQCKRERERHMLVSDYPSKGL